jgi:hypothetical protein
VNIWKEYRIAEPGDGAFVARLANSLEWGRLHVRLYETKEVIPFTVFFRPYVWHVLGEDEPYLYLFRRGESLPRLVRVSADYYNRLEFLLKDCFTKGWDSRWQTEGGVITTIQLLVPRDPNMLIVS